MRSTARSGTATPSDSIIEAMPEKSPNQNTIVITLPATTASRDARNTFPKVSLFSFLFFFAVTGLAPFCPTSSVLICSSI